jgi:hypothetical protein
MRSVAALASPLRGATRAARTSFPVAPALISLPGLVPPMVVMNVASAAFPMPSVVLVALIVWRHPIRIRIRGVGPVAVVPSLLTALREPIAIDPDVIGPGLGRDSVWARRRRRRADVEVERNLRLRCRRKREQQR